MIELRKGWLRALAAGVMALSVFGTRAQPAPDWPSRPITIIVPFAPGGLADTMGRMLAQHLGTSLKQTVLVENRPGAGTVIGSQAVARAKPDGYTFLLGSTANVLNSFFYRKMPFDSRQDLMPVAQLIELPNYLVVRPGSPFRSIQDVIARAREKPGSLSCGNYGAGTGGHLSCLLLARMGGVDLVHVPYKGGMPAIQDALAGQVDMAFVVEALPFIVDRKLVGLGVSTPRRNPYAPDIPAMTEQLPGFDVSSWEGIFAPAGTPAAIVRRVSADIQAMLQEEGNKARMKTLGVLPVLRPDAEFTAYVGREFDRWGEILKPMNIVLD